MNHSLTTKRILIFLAFAFGIPWITALVITLSGWLSKEPVQAQGTANLVFISTPWLASLATRLVTREGFGSLGLRPNLKRAWRFYLAAWLLPLAATIVGAGLFYLLFPQSFDPNLGAIQKLTVGTPAEAINPWLLFLSTAMSLVLVTTLINMVVSMGEELGWRGYLLPKLVDRFTPAGARKAALVTGLVHGVWHWPLILMSMSFVPSVTYLTPIMYLVFTCSLSVLLSWVTLRSGSVWTAALGHAAGNAAATLPGFMLKGSPITLLGPDATGLIGGIGYTIIALVLLFKHGAFGEEPQARAERTQPVVGLEIL